MDDDNNNGECAWGGLPHSLRVLPQLDQLEQQLLSTKTGIREARCYQKGWMFGKVPNGPLIFGKSCFWGHVDVCGFWYNFTIKYILNLKENLQYNFLDWKWIWKWIGNAPPPLELFRKSSVLVTHGLLLNDHLKHPRMPSKPTVEYFRSSRSKKGDKKRQRREGD